MDKRLFCTFTKKEELNDLIRKLFDSFTLKNDKIFILEAPNINEYVCTYNIEGHNINNFIPNTILVHRKKETNTLYTINALNEIIKWENNGVIDTSFKIEWKKFKNSIILTNDSGFRKIKTKLYKIISKHDE